jgi:hypothetical protein
MTQGPQQPEHQGPPPGYQGPPAMYPQFQPPNPSGGGRSGKTVIIIVGAVVIALVAVIALAFTLTRNSDGDFAAGPSSAASSSSAAAGADDFKLRGTLTSKASVCVAGGLTSQQMPKFETPLDYSRPTLDADITKARQDLSRLASRISPDAVEPIRSTMQDWITTFVDVLDSYTRREPAADVKWKGDLVDNLAGQINRICKE